MGRIRENQEGEMETEELFSVLADIANEVIGVDPATLTWDTNLREELNVDSLQLLEMLSVVEDRLPEVGWLGDDDLPDLDTFGDVVRYIAEHSKR